MKYLKIITIISFLLIDGLGHHGVPNFISIIMCLCQFFIDILNLFREGDEISWLLGMIGISTTISIKMICFQKKGDSYSLMVALIIMFVCEIFLSGILYYQELTLYFIFPLIVFITCSILLVIKSFKMREEITETDT